MCPARRGRACAWLRTRAHETSTRPPFRFQTRNSPRVDIQQLTSDIEKALRRSTCLRSYSSRTTANTSHPSTRFSSWIVRTTPQQCCVTSPFTSERVSPETIRGALADSTRTRPLSVAASFDSERDNVFSPVDAYASTVGSSRQRQIRNFSSPAFSTTLVAPTSPAIPLLNEDEAELDALRFVSPSPFLSNLCTPPRRPVPPY